MGVPDDVVGHAADEEPAHLAAAVTAHDDEVHLLAAGRVDDRLARVAVPDEEVDPDAGRATAGDELLCGRLAAGPDLVNAHSEAAAGQSKGPRIDDADDQEIGAKIVSQVQRLDGGALRRRRQVSRQEDTAYPSHRGRSGLSGRHRQGSHDCVGTHGRQPAHVPKVTSGTLIRAGGRPAVARVVARVVAVRLDPGRADAAATLAP